MKKNLDRIIQKLKRKFNIKNILKSLYENNKKFLAIMLIIIIVGNVAIYVKENINNNQPAPNFPSGMPVEDFDEYIQKQKDVPSDIEGYSVYDKYVMGLQRQDGSDSDYDGLTDKEEIELYGSDPLKASTSGDLYSDSYKVEHDMDLFQFYDYMEPMEYKYNECPEVLIMATCPTDFNCVVIDCTEKYKSEVMKCGIDSYIKGYELYNYNGNVSIDLKDITQKNKVKVYIGNGPFMMEGLTNFEKIDYEINETVISLDYQFDKHEYYYIYVAEPFTISVNSLFGKFFNREDWIDFSAINDDESLIALYYGFPLINAFGGKLHIDYIESEDDIKNYQFKDTSANHFAEKVIGAKRAAKFNVVSRKIMEVKRNFFDTYLSTFEYRPGDPTNSKLSYIFCYSVYKEEYNEKPKFDAYQINSGFDKYVDELPFQNFQSFIGTGGNCAGISHLTALLYNQKSVPTSGSYTCYVNGEFESVEWNINAASNKTLSDPGLFDYKSSSFVDINSDESNNYIGASLSDEEMEFVKMIGCYWAEGNDNIDMNDYLRGIDNRESVNLLDAMTNSIDQGKVLDVYLYMRDGTAHAVNLYNYRRYDETNIVFDLYDNNIPQDSRNGFKLDASGPSCVLSIAIVKDALGNETFEYIYWPMTSSLDYMATSAKGVQNTHAIVVMDENWNILN